MLQKLAWGARRWLDQGPVKLGYRIAVGALFVLGAYFRSRRYWIDPIGLWTDEAFWAKYLFAGSWTKFDFRPLGFMDATQLAVHLYSDERTIRIWSYLAGLGSLAIAFDVGRHVFRALTARLLCLAVFAFHPLLIDMSREYKPYSVELCVHLGLIWLFLRWRAFPTRARLYALLCSSVLAFLFAYNVVFLYPAIFGLLGTYFLGKKDYVALLVTAAAAGAAVALIAIVYFGVLRQMGTVDEGVQFWGGKYDVFYLPAGANAASVGSHARWLGQKYLDLAVFPDATRSKWVFPEWVSTAAASTLTTVNYYAWLALHAAGVLALFFRGRRQLLVLLLGPLLVTMAFNWFGIWPFGTFRANTFLLAYFILIPMIGLDALISWARRFGLVPAFVGAALIFLPALTVGLDLHERKHFFVGHSEIRTVFRRLKELREAGPAAARATKSYVLLDSYTCPPFEYYIHYNDGTRAAFGQYFADNFIVKCTRTPAGTRSFMRNLHGQSYFVVITDYRNMAKIKAVIGLMTTVLDEEQVRGTHDLYYVTGS